MSTQRVSEPKLNGRSILKYTMQLGLATVISKALGFVREILMARYLGVGPLADAFFTAFRIPNSLRKIFAEGALSAAFVPTLTQVVATKGKEEASRVTMLALIVLQTFLMIICGLAVFFAPFIVSTQVPGWLAEGGYASERFVTAVLLFKILIFYIIFISMSSLLAGTLQGVNKFSISAWGQIIANVVWIVQLWLCTRYECSLMTFSWLVLFNGLLYALIHAICYYAAGFRFSFVFDAAVWHEVWQGLRKFFPCALGLGAVEINLYIDQIVASYLPVGSLSLLNYTQGFVRLPLGVFAVAFGTILLPHFARMGRYASRRMGYYLLESAKLVLWVTLPATIMMSLFSYKIFYTTYYSFSNKFTLADVHAAGTLLIISIAGLFFLSINKIIINVFYALHETRWPTIITIVSTICNTILNIVGMKLFGLYGVVLATTIASIVQVVLAVFILHTYMKLPLYLRSFWDFFLRYVYQVTIVGGAGVLIYGALYYIISFSSARGQHLLFETLLYWFWVGPLCALCMLTLYVTRKRFKVRIHFLD